MERLIIAVLRNSAVPLTSAQVCDALILDEGEPYPLTSVKTRLSRMLADGVIDRGPGGRGYVARLAATEADRRRIECMVRAYGLDAVIALVREVAAEVEP